MVMFFSLGHLLHFILWFFVCQNGMKVNAQNATVKTAVCTSENRPSLYLI